jgi:hypothetical protein
MKILSLAHGKFKSVACFYQTDPNQRSRAEFQTVVTDHEDFRETITEACLRGGIRNLRGGVLCRLLLSIVSHVSQNSRPG